MKPSYLLQLNDIYVDNGQRFIYFLTQSRNPWSLVISCIFACILSSLLAVTSCISRHLCKFNFVIYCIWYHITCFICPPRLAIATFGGRSFSNFNSYHNKIVVVVVASRKKLSSTGKCSTLLNLVPRSHSVLH